VNARKLVLTGVLALLGALLLPVSAANAVVNLAAIPNFPTIVTAGQTAVAGTMTLLNGSTGVERLGSVTLQSITMVPSCVTFATGCPGAGDADPGTFILSPSGTGRTGTGCEGMTFNIAVTNPITGEVTFEGGPVVLQAPSVANDLDSCVIDFTFTVNRQPNHDSLPGTAGIQTNQLGEVTGQHADRNSGSGAGADVTTVNGGATTPTIATQASPSVRLGGQLTDTATLGGGTDPTGTITFTLFGPDDITCSGSPVFTSVKTVSGNGGYTSDPFTPTAAGTYRWRAAYGGDGANGPVSTGCDDPNERVSVAPRSTTTITTQALSPVTLTRPVHDTATLSGAVDPTGTLTFTLFGAGDASCEGTSIFNSTVPVTGEQSVSADFTPTAPGSYHWVAAYSGDAGNTPSAGGCGDAGETSVVTVLPTINVEKAADPVSRPEPGGSFTFTVKVTNTSTQTLTLTSIMDDKYGDLNGRGSCAAGGTITAGATFACSFDATFTGNAGASQTDTVIVTATEDAGVTTVNGSAQATIFLAGVKPTVAVQKDAHPTSLPEPGGDFTFDVAVTNTSSSEPVILTRLTDDVYGNLNGSGSCRTGGTIAPGGGSYACTFTGSFAGQAGATQTDTVTATVTDDEGEVATAADPATVTITSSSPPPGPLSGLLRLLRSLLPFL
jgi:hypothetical protein